MKEPTLKELQIICMELHCATGRIWSTNDMLKCEIVNNQVKAFGGDQFAEKTVPKRSKKIYNPETLVCKCTA